MYILYMLYMLYIYIYVYIYYMYLGVAIESWTEWNLNPPSLNSIQMF